MAAVQRPGTPRLLRSINDRAALELLSQRGPLTRAQIGELTGLSKVTAGQLIGRLERRGLVSEQGESSMDSVRGPNARLYGLVADAAYVVGVVAGRDALTVALADLSGRRRAEVRTAVTEGEPPVATVVSAVEAAAGQAGVPLAAVGDVVIGAPGLVDPATGELEFSWDLPAWRHGLIGDLRAALGVRVAIDNDVNLVATAERAAGAASGSSSFALLWLGAGLGMALVVDGEPVRGASGGAGEVGYLPVPGAPVSRLRRRARTSGRDGSRGVYRGGLQSLVSAPAVRALARQHRLGGRDVTTVISGALRRPTGAAFLDELAGRIALGVAAVCTVVDPDLIVLTGDVGWAGGPALADRVADRVADISPLRPHVVPGQVDEQPVLRGALLSALSTTRDHVFDSTTDGSGPDGATEEVTVVG